MTTADETPACRAQYPPSHPDARIIRCHLERGHPGEHEEADTEVTWTNDDVRPDAAPVPDGNAGGAGLDLAAIRGRAELAARGTYWRDDEPDGWQEAVESLSTQDVPALLAEIERLTAETERFMARADSADYQRDVARRELADLIDLAGSGETRAEMQAHIAQIDGELETALIALAEARAEVDRLNRVSDLNPFGSELGDACCVDAAGSTPDEVLHTGGCPNRCSVHTPTPLGNKIRAYPCALTADHAGDHWMPPSYREPVTDDGGATDE